MVDNFMDLDIQAVCEATSSASYMNVKEMRILYYGRLNLFVSFSNDEDYALSGELNGDIVRPYGLLTHPLDEVVAKKVNTSMFYGHVFRYTPRGTGFIHNIATYSADDYQRDVGKLFELGYLDYNELVYSVKMVSANARLRSYFERLWKLTKSLADTSIYEADLLWARILIDLGYDGFTDPTGKKILSPAKGPTTLILQYEDADRIDIMAVQKSREDKRRSVQDRINLKMKYMKTARNKIAKKTTGSSRVKAQVSFLGEMAKASIKEGIDI